MIKAPGFLFLAAGIAGLLGSAGLANAASTSVTVYPPVSQVDRGPPPSFQQYPLINRIFGFGGAIYPDYVDPSTERHETKLAYLTGGGQGRMVFAAGTADRLCQMEQAPQVVVLNPPARGTLSFDLGKFAATGSDGGSRHCVGGVAEGVRVFYSGKAPKGGTTATLRVSYPRFGRSYTHVVAIPAQ